MDVCIRIKDPVLRSYLSALFVEHEDGFTVKCDTLTGSAICSLVQVSPLPARPAKTLDMVRFYLPKSDYTRGHRSGFLHMPAVSQSLVELCLKKEFETHFLTFCTERRILGFRMKDIIPLFIHENKLEIFDGDTETLKKRFYRKEIGLLLKLEEKLRQKAYFNSRKYVKKNGIAGK